MVHPPNLGIRSKMDDLRQRLGPVRDSRRMLKAGRRATIVDSKSGALPPPRAACREGKENQQARREAQITVTLKNGAVTIRKTNPNGPDHTHDLRASDIRKAIAQPS